MAVLYCINPVLCTVAVAQERCEEKKRGKKDIDFVTISSIEVLKILNSSQATVKLYS